MQTWSQAWDARRTDDLNRLSYPDPDANHSYRETLWKAGHRVASWALVPYVQPKWPIFRTTEFVPPPTWWADVSLENPKGSKVDIYVALAPTLKGFVSCALQSRAPVPKKSITLDLRQELDRVRVLMESACNSLPENSVARFDVSFSANEGTLAVDATVGDEIVEDLATALVPAWAELREHGGRIIGLDGKTGRLAAGSKSLDERLGMMIIQAIHAMRDQGYFLDRSLATTAVFGVSETDGRFGWPRHKDEGQTNRLGPTRESNVKAKSRPSRRR